MYLSVAASDLWPKSVPEKTPFAYVACILGTAQLKVPSMVGSSPTAMLYVPTYRRQDTEIDCCDTDYRQ